jgi:hypothetical protein
MKTINAQTKGKNGVNLFIKWGQILKAHNLFSVG